MARVHNWQLGREMSYTFAPAYPERQFAFVFNTNRCIACQSCTMACKSTWTFSKGQEHMWWANGETKPYGGYPQSWDVKILKMLRDAHPEGQYWREKLSDGRYAPYGEFNGKTIFEANDTALRTESSRVLGCLPTDKGWISPNIYQDNPGGPKGVRTALPTPGTELPVHHPWLRYLGLSSNPGSYPACLG